MLLKFCSQMRNQGLLCITATPAPRSWGAPTPGENSGMTGVDSEHHAEELRHPLEILAAGGPQERIRPLAGVAVFVLCVVLAAGTKWVSI